MVKTWASEVRNVQLAASSKNMQEASREAISPDAELTPPITTLTNFNSRPARTLTKILLVNFRNGEAVGKHPELQQYISDGWSIRSAVPRLVESEGTKLLVVMAKPESGARLKRIK